MTQEIIGLVVLAAIFAISTVLPVHIGAMALVAAFGVGLGLGGESVKDIFGGFPVDIMILLIGVTYLFGMARHNGALDWLVESALRRAGGKTILLPWVFFFLSMGIGSLGTPQTIYVLIPVAMSVAWHRGISPTMMGVAAAFGSTAGGFSPTSLFGIITDAVAERAGLPFSPLTMFGSAFAFCFVLFGVAFVIFGGMSLRHDSGDVIGSGGKSIGTPGPTPTGGESDSGPAGTATAVVTRPAMTTIGTGAPTKLTGRQLITLLTLAAVIVLVVVLTAAGFDVNIGVVTLTAAVALSLAMPDFAKGAFGQVDWSTVLLVGGVVTYVGVLQRMGAIDLLGQAAESIPSPVLAGLVLCVTGALVSAFASTVGILGALVPLAVPLLVVGGPLAGTGLLYALGISSALVDCSPFSTTGATTVASTAPEDRERTQRLLTRWGLSMIVVGPVLTCALLVLPQYLG